MKPDRTIIRLSFPHPIYGTFTPIRVEYEYPLGPNDNDQDALDDGKARAEAWFTSRYPPIDGGNPQPSSGLRYYTPEQVAGAIPIQETVRSKLPEDQRIAQMISDIYSCPDIKTLEAYRLLAKTKPEFQAAYDEQYKKLSNGLVAN